MASRLFARRQKKATTIVSKQTLEQAVQEARGIVEGLMGSAPNDSRIDQLQEAISFLESIISKGSLEMQQDGAAQLDDYLDDAVMPEMAQKIKQDVDMIANMKNATSQQTQAPVATIASGSDNWVNDREEDGKPKTPELAEVPRMAAAGAAVAPAAAPKAVNPDADIQQLSSDVLAKMLKALSTAEDLMNDKAANKFIGAIAAELAARPVEVEQPKAPAAQAPLPVAASFGGLSLVASEEKIAVTPPGVSEKLMHKLKSEYPGDEEAAYATAWKIHNEKGAALAALNKAASGQGGSWFVNDGDTGNVTENGGRTPEIAEAHSEVDDNTGIARPVTVSPIKLAAALEDLPTPKGWPERSPDYSEGYKDGYNAGAHAVAQHLTGSKTAAGDMTTNKAVKMVERLGEELKALYLEAKPVTQVLDSRPVREAVESVYRAYDMMGEAAKVLNKLNMQEESEAAALEVKEKNKKSSFAEGKCRYCGNPTEYNFCSEKCRKANNEEMSKGDFASPEDMQSKKKSSLMDSLVLAGEE